MRGQEIWKKAELCILPQKLQNLPITSGQAEHLEKGITLWAHDNLQLMAFTQT